MGRRQGAQRQDRRARPRVVPAPHARLLEAVGEQGADRVLRAAAVGVDLYKRSLLIVRTQIDEGGGIIAANDSDIMHFARDTYSYVWPRDGALVAHALDMAGYPETSRTLLRTSAPTCITPDGYLLHKYNPDKSLASSWHPWVGGRRARPGPISSVAAAADSRGRDRAGGMGHVAPFSALSRYRHDQASLWSPGAQRRRLHGGYREPKTGLPAPSYDLWEERRGILTSPARRSYGGLARRRRVRAPPSATTSTPHAMRRRRVRSARPWIVLVAPGAGSLRPHDQRARRRHDRSRSGDRRLAVRHLRLRRLSPPTIRSVEATMKAVRDRCGARPPVGGVARYETTTITRSARTKTTSPAIPGSSAPCGWRCIRSPRPRRIEELNPAIEILEWVDSRKLPSGVLAEQVNPYTNAPMSRVAADLEPRRPSSTWCSPIWRSAKRSSAVPLAAGPSAARSRLRARLEPGAFPHTH